MRGYLGPWEVGMDYGKFQTEIVSVTDSRAIALVWTKKQVNVKGETKIFPDQIGLDTAKLISRAPDMVDCLIELRGLLKPGYGVTITNPAATISAVERVENLLQELGIDDPR